MPGVSRKNLQVSQQALLDDFLVESKLNPTHPRTWPPGWQPYYEGDKYAMHLGERDWYDVRSWQMIEAGCYTYEV
jgi:hypothetical protein